MNLIEDSAEHLPFCLHELTPRHRTTIALVRSEDGLEVSAVQKADLMRTSEEDKRALRLINRTAIRFASALSALPRYTGIVYRGIGVRPETVAAWVKSHPVGLMLCDPPFVGCSPKMSVALKYGHNLLIRMRSCSGVMIGPLSPKPSDELVVFAPGESFVIIRQGLHRLRKSRRSIWVVDVEETSWPSGELPRWENYPVPGEVLEERFVPGAVRSGL